jgi:hypothetical protein
VPLYTFSSLSCMILLYAIFSRVIFIWHIQIWQCFLVFEYIVVLFGYLFANCDYFHPNRILSSLVGKKLFEKMWFFKNQNLKFGYYIFLI